MVLSPKIPVMTWYFSDNYSEGVKGVVAGCPERMACLAKEGGAALISSGWMGPP